MEMSAAAWTGCDLHNLLAQAQRMNNPGAVTPDDSHRCRTVRALLRVAWQCGLAEGAVVGYKRIAIRALIGSRHQFETAERTVEVEGRLTVGADVILFGNRFSTAGAKRRAAVAAEAIFQEYGRIARRAFAGETRR